MRSPDTGGAIPRGPNPNQNPDSRRNIPDSSRAVPRLPDSSATQSRKPGLEERREAATVKQSPPAEHSEYQLPTIELPEADPQGSTDRMAASPVQANAAGDEEINTQQDDNTSGTVDRSDRLPVAEREVFLADAPPIDPPTKVPPTEFGDFPADESVFDMEEQERVDTMDRLEQFAAGGRLYKEVVSLDGETGQHEEIEEGFRRTVPRGALAAEEMAGYDVEVATVRASIDHPYEVRITATRVVPCEVDLRMKGELVHKIGEGEEIKQVGFAGEEIEGFDPMLTVNANSSMVAPRYSLPELAEMVDGGVQPVLMVDHDTPLLGLGEVRAIMRAVENAHRYSRESALVGSAERATYATLGRVDFSDVEVPTEGSSYSELSQLARGVLMTEIDRFARVGRGEDRGDLTHYERKIPEEILRSHGFEGSATAVIEDDLAGEVYSVSISTSQRVEGLVGFRGSLVDAEGVKDGTLSLFATRGPKTDVSQFDPPIDRQAGGGIHLEYAGNESYAITRKGPPEKFPTGDITYRETVALLEALRQANNQRAEK